MNFFSVKLQDLTEVDYWNHWQSYPRTYSGEVSYWHIGKGKHLLKVELKKWYATLILGIHSGTNNVTYYKYMKGYKEMSSSKHGVVKKKVYQVLIYFFKIVIGTPWTWENPSSRVLAGGLLALVS